MQLFLMNSVIVMSLLASSVFSYYDEESTLPSPVQRATDMSSGLLA